jgi:hypothetical protein
MPSMDSGPFAPHSRSNACVEASWKVSGPVPNEPLVHAPSGGMNRNRARPGTPCITELRCGRTSDGQVHFAVVSH